MFTPSTEAKCALFLADGCEEIEALTVADLLYRAGIPCTKISITDRLEVVSSHEIHILADACIADTDLDAFDMLILPGGVPGTPNLGACTVLTDAVGRFAASGKWVAAICAAPSILAKLGILQGRTASCNPTVEDVLTENGAVLSRESVSICDRIITSRAMGTAIPFGLARVAHFLGQERADALGAQILYRWQGAASL